MNTERESLPMDVVCVGGGVASLTTALRLLKRVQQAGDAGLEPPHVLIIEKGPVIGAHVLSGAVVDPAAFTVLLSAEEQAELPVESCVASETFHRLSRHGGIKLPFIPGPMRVKGFPIMSVGKLARYLGGLCEKAGAAVMTGFSAESLLKDGQGRVTGVRIGDKGIDKNGQRRTNFMSGPDVPAKVVVLGEGGCGILSDQLIADQGLASTASPQTYALAIKEIVEVPENPARVGGITHTFGYPLDYFTYGGGFVYRMNARQVAIGLVTALDYHDADLNPHELLLAYKQHPLIAAHIEGGKVVEYGAKVIPEGGAYAVPAQVTDGAMIVGDSAGLLDSLRLKGVHIAMQSGIAAGDALFECWRKNDFSAKALSAYPSMFRGMSGWREMNRVRNVRAAFARGSLPGVLAAGLSLYTNGILPPGRLRMTPDWQAMRPRKPGKKPPVPVSIPKNSPLPLLDRLTAVFYSGTRHEENQPCHLKILDPEICRRNCIPVYGAPCTRFCPAQVYNLEGDRIRVDFANCLHCKTCQIKDPLRNIKWALPEGGDGPRYKNM